MLGHASHGSVGTPKRTLCALAGLLAVLAGCSGSPSPPPSRPASARPDVQFLGPSRLTERGTLNARAASRSGRVVAVTFYLDGQPIGSDTTAPYGLDLDPAFIPPGRHRVRVGAVDSLGQRRMTKPAAVTTAASTSGIVTASPGHGLARAVAALRRGGVTVHLAPGRYELGRLQLGSGARLVGSGPRTVIAPRPGANYWALVVAKGSEIRISDLTIDGGGSMPATPDGGIALAVFDGSRDVRMQRIRFSRVRTYGVNVWGAHTEVSVQDSLIESNGGAQAGVFSLGSDRSRDTSVIRTRILGFRSYGILLGQNEFGRRRAALHGVALDNVIRDIRDPARDACRYAPRAAPGCGTNEGGIWSGGVEAAIIGNTIDRARWDGIETVGSSTRTTIVGNEIRDTRTGIYLERSTNDSLIARNGISGAPTGINVEWRHGGGGSSRNTFSRNRIVGAEAGLFVDVGGDGNTIVGNVFVGGRRPAITLQGSSANLVQDNTGCRTAGAMVALQSARRDDGSPAHSLRNRLVENRSVRSC
jgi:parallel beta-helix repeat protein